jgi:hypothetical protein
LRVRRWRRCVLRRGGGPSCRPAWGAGGQPRRVARLGDGAPPAVTGTSRCTTATDSTQRACGRWAGREIFPIGGWGGGVGCSMAGPGCASAAAGAGQHPSHPRRSQREPARPCHPCPHRHVGRRKSARRAEVLSNPAPTRPIVRCGSDCLAGRSGLVPYRDILRGRHGLEPRVQVGLACLKFVDEHLDRFDGDPPHPVRRLGPVSHEPYAAPGCEPSVIREPHVHAACRGQLPLPGAGTTSADAGLQALHYGAVRARIKVIGRDASAVAARDADKVPVWLSRR